MQIQLEKLSYSVAEVEHLVGVCRVILYREMNSGNLKASKIGKKTLITRDSLNEWLQSLESYSPKESKMEAGNA